jgi:hypothetical protein
MGSAGNFHRPGSAAVLSSVGLLGVVTLWRNQSTGVSLAVTSMRIVIVEVWIMFCWLTSDLKVPWLSNLIDLPGASVPPPTRGAPQWIHEFQ